MEVTTSMNQNIDTLFSNIESFTQNEGTLGKPVTQGDKTLIPIISVTIGYGGGNTSGKMSTSTTTSTQGSSNAGMDALGLGARISTDALAVVDGNNVTVIPVSAASSNMNQLINQIPQMMGKGQSGQGQSGQSQSQQQNQPQSY
ncbi:MAG TPA: spore germination protein GerW family protein [Patescibacteria group bacterium]|nr:spore germination protein GerW family protein [Patescibacteria group bacterium]